MREGGGIPVDCAQSNFSSFFFFYKHNTKSKFPLNKFCGHMCSVKRKTSNKMAQTQPLPCTWQIHEQKS